MFIYFELLQMYTPLPSILSRCMYVKNALLAEKVHKYRFMESVAKYNRVGQVKRNGHKLGTRSEYLNSVYRTDGIRSLVNFPDASAMISSTLKPLPRYHQFNISPGRQTQPAPVKSSRPQIQLPLQPWGFSYARR